LRQVRVAVEGLTRRAHQTGGTGSSASFAAQANGITAEFLRKLGALPANMTALERAAAIRAFKDERDAALRALHERRATARHGEKQIRRAMRDAACRP
jgi:hypothetical protein